MPYNSSTLPLIDQALDTPAYVYHEARIMSVLDRLSTIHDQTGLQVLYSIKAASVKGLLERIAPSVSGFSCSSLFECRLAREVLAPEQVIHVTSPGLCTANITEIAKNSDYISFNSLRQLQGSPRHMVSYGLRVNPGLSFIADPRYDPCCPHSKLGVPLDGLLSQLSRLDNLPPLEGLHFHNNHASSKLEQLGQSVSQLDGICHHLAGRLKWLNLGGGYYLDDEKEQAKLTRLIERLDLSYGMQVFFEPGQGVVGPAGYLISRVIDLLEYNGQKTAILDTTINHLPEVFEYQYQPMIEEARPDGAYRYHIAGCSCLSGDHFGEYAFDHRLRIGERLSFSHVGAYMLSKANMFNGINLPTIYLLNRSNQLERLAQYDYDTFRRIQAPPQQHY